jgi:putative tryptophan/tyrosine transport system substrate-binding protein
MKRRTFITLLGGAAASLPLAAQAQQTGRVWRVALIGVVSPLPAMLSAFREVLQQRGWTEGKNLSIDVRWPKGSFAQDPGLISEVLHSNVDVIVAWATPTALAVRRATSTIPIVFLGISDPVGSGLAASLAHPGGNATGSSNVAPDLSAKLVGTFAQLVPGMSSVGVVVNPANPGSVAQMDGTQQALHALGLQSQVVNAGTLEEYERAFARLKIEGVNGVLLLQDPSNTGQPATGKIAELAQQHRLPTAFQNRENVAAGGLMSYGTDLDDQFRLAAFYVDRILRGEKPADLPVQLPTKFNLVINLKTAKALGLEVPPTLLALADEVIE